jgi:hypothetical protein
MSFRLGLLIAISWGVFPLAAPAAVFTFDSSAEVVLSPAPGPNVWYADRYPPAGFASGQIGGGRTGVLLENISAGDSAAGRPAAFSSAFYNTQGRKYDLTSGTNALFIDVFVSQSWDEITAIDGRLASFWATGFNASNVENGLFPIIEFNNNRPGAAGDGFRVWDSNTGWTNVAGFDAYNQWYRVGFVLSGGNELFFVNNNLVATVADTATTQFGNVILQGYNSGQSYNIAWDNLSATPDQLDALPEPGTLSMFAVAIAGVGVGVFRRRKLVAA